MARKKPETALQNRIRDAITKRWPDTYIIKVHGNPYQMAGVPDLLMCVQGKFIGIEVKMPGNAPTALQYVHMERIKTAGGGAAWVNNVEDAVIFVRQCIEG